ncbi:MAG: DNA primase [Lentisphaeria bacterium]|jgi:DNA primase
MSRIPSNFIDDLLNRLDIVDVIDRRVKLKKAGKNYSACCPFHQEKTPSFTVSPDKQFYYCFGCGATGNALGFIMEYDSQSFIDAIETLAKQAGMEVPRESSPRSIQQDSHLKLLYDILEKSSDYFQGQLLTHQHKHLPINYLKQRGLTGSVAKSFGLGYAPPGYENLLGSLGKNEEQRKLLADAGLIIKKEDENKIYDRFRHRITFPIRDTRGRVMGFGGRVLGDDKPKYLNSPETKVFHKGRELYGLFEARKNNRNLETLIVVEGYMDVIALSQFGISNAVATLGTACGEDHLKLAFKYVSGVVFCFDGDNAGRKAAKRALTNSLTSMEDGRQIKFLFLPEGQDPDTLVRQIGTERFQNQIRNAVPLEEFLFDAAAEGTDISSMEGRARLSKIVAPLLSTLPDGVFRELMFGNLAKRTGLAPEVLRELQKEKILWSEEKHIEPASVDDDEKAQTSASTNNSRFDAPNIPGEPPQEPFPKTRPRLKNKSTVTLTPAKTATILLLENPELLQKLDTVPEISEHADEDCQRLKELIAYLEKRPKSNFNNILGYWGGAKGVDAQQQLAKLLANQLLTTAKIIDSYDPLKELQDALMRIQSAQKRADSQIELQQLKARGLANLSLEEKNRYRELTKMR